MSLTFPIIHMPPRSPRRRKFLSTQPRASTLSNSSQTSHNSIDLPLKVPNLPKSAAKTRSRASKRRHTYYSPRSLATDQWIWTIFSPLQCLTRLPRNLEIFGLFLVVSGGCYGVFRQVPVLFVVFSAVFLYSSSISETI